MTEVLWVALISAGSAVVVALMTQYLATRAAEKQSDRQARQEELQWQRSEARRLRDEKDARFREFWALVLLAQGRVLDHTRAYQKAGAHVAIPSAESAATAAAQAYAVALLGLGDVRPLAKDFYHATARVQIALETGKMEDDGIPEKWRKSFGALEQAVMKEFSN